MQKNFDVIILGGGPAGAQCALWLKMLGLTPALVEKSERLGGLQARAPYQNNWIVTSPPSQTGEQTARIIDDHLKQKDVAVFLNSTKQKLERRNGRFVLSIDGKELQARKLVIATGVRSRDGGFISTERVLIGSGRIIEDFNFEGLKVAILGGGDTAAENYHFQKSKKPKAIKIFARTLRARKNLLEGIPVEDIFEGAYKADQEQMTVNDETFDVFCVMYGWEPVNPLPADIKCKMSAEGFFNTDERSRTSDPDIFAIGECAGRNHPCVATALGDAVACAKEIQKDLEA